MALTDLGRLTAAGDTLFYNSNILHCAAYSPAMKRATLHGTMGSTASGASRARNVLQHGLAWMASRAAPADGHTAEPHAKPSSEPDAQLSDGEHRNGEPETARWVPDPAFRETLTPRGKVMLDNLVRMRQSVGDGEVGYSLQN
jgi:hypothetical protein